MAKKTQDVLIIKNTIETLFETGKLGGLTPAQANEILNTYSDIILMNRAGETINKSVADWFSQFAFMLVKPSGIGWLITYRG